MKAAEELERANESLERRVRDVRDRELALNLHLAVRQRGLARVLAGGGDVRFQGDLRVAPAAAREIVPGREFRDLLLQRCGIIGSGRTAE